MKVAQLVILLVLSVRGITSAQQPTLPQEHVLYTFQNGADGAYPTSGVVADSSGNLYGTMESGVYEVSPPSPPGGAWTESVLYVFQGGADGNGPQGNLVLDPSGNLYGTTYGGGINGNCCGTIFELSPPSLPGGPWIKTTLYSFLGGAADGQAPNGYLVFDNTGAIFGTTQAGGNSCTANFSTCGTIFKLAPPSVPGSTWTESVIYLFQGGKDGADPVAGLTLDSTHNFYGTTELGGQGFACNEPPGCGTVFALTRPGIAGDAWIETVISRFRERSGSQQPRGSVTVHADALYGTTYTGTNGGPTVFELSLVNGIPTRTTLFASGPGQQCVASYSGVSFDPSGNMYGTTSASGCEGGGGFVYRLKPPNKQGGHWSASIFPGMDGEANGNAPAGGVTILGNSLYGATYQGGNLNCDDNGFGCGIVYSYGP